MTGEDTICQVCISNLKFANPKRIEEEFERKYGNKKIISGFTSLYIFEKGKEFQSIIHSLKYRQRFLIGLFLGKMTGTFKQTEIKSWEIDYIFPVPLHFLKQTERGFNQAFYIAKGIGKSLNIPVKQNFLKRKKYTLSQTTMNTAQREINVQNAFYAKNIRKFKGKNVLLVDDVITTGATTNECGSTLLKNGANKVYAVSVAIAD